MKARKPSKQQRLNAAKARSHSALTLFHSAHDELVAAAETASAVCDEARSEAHELLALATTADEQAVANVQQAKRLREFLGEGSE